MRTVLLALLLGGLLSACYYDNEEELYPAPVNCVPDTVSYSAHVAPIIQNRCLSCHSASENSGQVTLEGHSALKTYADNGKLLPAIKHTGPYPMPKAQQKLSDCQISLIENWVNAGALQN